MTTLSLRLPNSIHQNAKLYAHLEGISVNQLAATALAEKLAALAAEDCIARAQRANLAEFEAALALVPDVPAQAGDGYNSKNGFCRLIGKRKQLLKLGIQHIPRAAPATFGFQQHAARQQVGNVAQVWSTGANALMFTPRWRAMDERADCALSCSPSISLVLSTSSVRTDMLAWSRRAMPTSFSCPSNRPCARLTLANG